MTDISRRFFSQFLVAASAAAHKIGSPDATPAPSAMPLPAVPPRLRPPGIKAGESTTTSDLIKAFYRFANTYATGLQAKPELSDKGFFSALHEGHLVDNGEPPVIQYARERLASWMEAQQEVSAARQLLFGDTVHGRATKALLNAVNEVTADYIRSVSTSLSPLVLELKGDPHVGGDRLFVTLEQQANAIQSGTASLRQQERFSFDAPRFFQQRFGDSDRCSRAQALENLQSTKYHVAMHRIQKQYGLTSNEIKTLDFLESYQPATPEFITRNFREALNYLQANVAETHPHYALSPETLDKELISLPDFLGHAAKKAIRSATSSLPGRQNGNATSALPAKKPEQITPAKPKTPLKELAAPPSEIESLKGPVERLEREKTALLQEINGPQRNDYY